jgi:hypothetical protein
MAVKMCVCHTEVTDINASVRKAIWQKMANDVYYEINQCLNPIAMQHMNLNVERAIAFPLSSHAMASTIVPVARMNSLPIVPHESAQKIYSSSVAISSAYRKMRNAIMKTIAATIRTRKSAYAKRMNFNVAVASVLVAISNVILMPIARMRVTRRIVSHEIVAQLIWDLILKIPKLLPPKSSFHVRTQQHAI